VEEFLKTNGGVDGPGITVRLFPLEGDPLLEAGTELEARLLRFAFGCWVGESVDSGVVNGGVLEPVKVLPLVGRALLNPEEGCSGVAT
jgi:hypothetical protein